MRGGRLQALVLVSLLAAGLAGCVDTREFDCTALMTTYVASCSDYVTIDPDTATCALVYDRQGAGTLQHPIDRAARVCAEAGTDCAKLFVCRADADGLSAVTPAARVTGMATVKGQTFAFDVGAAWAWLGTKGSGRAGDLVVLFVHDGHPWVFKLDDFAARWRAVPFVVDDLQPIKLVSVLDRTKFASGTVRIDAFAAGGAFDLTATSPGVGAGDAIALRVRGDFRVP